MAYQCRNRTELDRATVRLRSVADGVSLQSDAISRKSRYRAKATSELDHKSLATMSSWKPTNRLGDSSKQPVPVPEQLEPAQQYLRPKNLFQGVYFPCMGNIVSGGVLSGTEIFPFSPKQEKLHFMHAVTAPLDHLDGQPDNRYLDDILVHMKIKMEAWEDPNQPGFLDEENSKFDEVILNLL